MPWEVAALPWHRVNDWIAAKVQIHEEQEQRAKERAAKAKAQSAQQSRLSSPARFGGPTG